MVGRLQNIVELNRSLDDGKLRDTARRVAATPDDWQALYDLAYQCYEVHLFGIAATLLGRANAITPRTQSIVTELVCNLEEIGANEESCRILRDSGLSESDFFCRYLLAFNVAMTGDLSKARRSLPDMEKACPKEFEFATRTYREKFCRLLRMHAPGQILWSHATRWTSSAPIAADLVKFLYQTNYSPWGERLGVDPATKKTTRMPRNEEPVEILARDIVSAQAEAPSGEIEVS